MSAQRKSMRRSRLLHGRYAIGMALIVATVLFSPVGATASPLLPPHNPPSNIEPNPANGVGCSQDAFEVDNSPDCVASALAAIDSARAKEGVTPLSMNLKVFESLSQADQLFAIFNLERIDRGLDPIEYTTVQLDASAQTAAQADEDPSAPSTLTGGIPWSEWTGVWAGPEENVLWTDYVWMYDDGWGGSVVNTTNLVCTSAASGACWDHRDAILLANPESGCYLAAGTSVVANRTQTGAPYPGLSYVGLIIESCGAVPADVNLSWKTLETQLAGSGELEISNQSAFPGA
jgi:hypothetical protein